MQKELKKLQYHAEKLVPAEQDIKMLGDRMTLEIVAVP